MRELLVSMMAASALSVLAPTIASAQQPAAAAPAADDTAELAKKLSNPISDLVSVPFIGQPPLFDGDVSTFGVGDMTTSFFFSPKDNSGFTWGGRPGVRDAVELSANDWQRTLQHRTNRRCYRVV
jgi:hypothetical protein